MWFIGLAGLALASVPTDATCAASQTQAAATTVYYSPTQATSVYQDVDGTHTVHVRTLRPVVSQ